MDFDSKVSLVLEELEELGWYWECEDELHYVLSKYFNENHATSSFEKFKKQQRKKELLEELAKLEEE